MSIRKRILPSGSTVWLADYRDGAGKRRAKQFSKKSEADAFLQRTREEIGQGVHVPGKESIAFGEAAKRWLGKADADGLERATVTRYRQTYDLHVAPAFAGLKLAAITPPQIQHHIDGLAGTMSDDEAVADMAARFEQLTEAWLAARGRKAA